MNSESDSNLELSEFVDVATTMSCDSLKSLLQNDHLHEEEKLPKSFLQLKGILIGNYNMAWNFHISSAIRIMIQHNLAILAIQEHTAWSRTLTEHKFHLLKDTAINGNILLLYPSYRFLLQTNSSWRVIAGQR